MQRRRAAARRRGDRRSSCACSAPRARSAPWRPRWTATRFRAELDLDALARRGEPETWDLFLATEPGGRRLRIGAQRDDVPDKPARPALPVAAGGGGRPAARLPPLLDGRERPQRALAPGPPAAGAAPRPPSRRRSRSASRGPRAAGPSRRRAARGCGGPPCARWRSPCAPARAARRRAGRARHGAHPAHARLRRRRDDPHGAQPRRPAGARATTSSSSASLRRRDAPFIPLPARRHGSPSLDDRRAGRAALAPAPPARGAAQRARARGGPRVRAVLAVERRPARAPAARPARRRAALHPPGVQRHRGGARAARRRHRRPGAHELPRPPAGPRRPSCGGPTRELDALAVLTHDDRDDYGASSRAGAHARGAHPERAARARRRPLVAREPARAGRGPAHLAEGLRPADPGVRDGGARRARVDAAHLRRGRQASRACAR